LRNTDVYNRAIQYLSHSERVLIMGSEYGENALLLHHMFPDISIHSVQNNDESLLVTKGLLTLNGNLKYIEEHKAMELEKYDTICLFLSAIQYSESFHCLNNALRLLNGQGQIVLFDIYGYSEKDIQKFVKSESKNNICYLSENEVDNFISDARLTYKKTIEKVSSGRLILYAITNLG